MFKNKVYRFSDPDVDIIIKQLATLYKKIGLNERHQQDETWRSTQSKGA